ncbi:MAG: hypothetical protein AAF587_24375 [Bacteroidota bacterium]
MGKKELDLQKLDLGNKKVVKKDSLTQDSMETAVKSIHSPANSKERSKRVTIDLPVSLYKRIRNKTIEEEITLKDYFMSLSEKDLEKLNN